MIESLVTAAYLKRKFPNNPAMHEVIDFINHTLYYLHQEYLNSGTNPAGEYKWKKNIVDLNVKMVAALGHGHEMHGNLSTILGNYGNITRSYRETVMGSYAKDPQNQNPTEWIPWDMLLTLGNGPDKDHRSNAFEIYKNGFFRFLQAIAIGAYPALPEGQTPKPGSLQFTTEKGFEKWNDETKEWEPLIGNTTNIINNTFVENTTIVNNTTTIIYLGQNPAAASVRVYLNGIRQHYTTYTVSGNTVTLNEAPWPGDDVLIFYEAWKADISITEIPSGAIDGVNVDFVCSEIPEPTSLNAYLNGVLLHPRKYTIAGATIYLVEAPFEGDTVLVDYLMSSDSGHAYNETPSGAINGVNVNFTLARAPTDEKAKVYLNGVRQIPTMHYSIAGAIITFLTAPFDGDQIICDYEY